MSIPIFSSRPPEQRKTRAVGIDLGTTNSLVAVVAEDGQPKILLGDDGQALVPSVIGFEVDGQLDVVGAEADEHLAERPDRTIYSVKRMMGRSADEVVSELGMLPYRVHRDDQSAAVRIQVGDRRYTPPELSAFVLRELKQRAEKQLGQVVDRAVITVPAYFNDAQRQATK
ncbi:MAG: Hsp70 family protein, partial [Myxococcota bacterium]